MFKANNEKGYLSIEAIGVMILVLIGIGGSIVTVNSMMRSSRLADAQQEIAIIITKTKQAFSGSSNYTGLTNSVAQSLDVFPDDIANNPVNPWGGAYTVAALASDNSKFTLTVEKVPPKQCPHLAVFRQGSWDSIKVGSTTIDQSSATVVTAVTACGTSPSTITYQSL